MKTVADSHGHAAYTNKP